MFKDIPEPSIKAFDIDRVQTAALVARSINELMKTKVETIKVAKEIIDDEPKDI